MGVQLIINFYRNVERFFFYICVLTSWPIGQCVIYGNKCWYSYVILHNLTRGILPLKNSGLIVYSKCIC